MKNKSVTSELCKKLKVLRHSRGWSQGQLAERFGVSTQRVSRYERGLIIPPTEMTVRIASVYNVSLDYLLRGEDAPVSKIRNQLLLERIEEIDSLSAEDQRVLTILLDAFIKKRKFETLIKNNEQEEELLYAGK